MTDQVDHPSVVLKYAAKAVQSTNELKESTLTQSFG